MDVAKLQKVNQLTQTLKQHGIVASTEDALEVASRITGKYDEDDFSRIISEHDRNIGLVETKIEQNKDMLKKEQVVEILQSFADQLIEEINTINEKLKEHEDFISYLKGNNNDNEAAAIELEDNTDKVLGVGEAEEIYLKQKQKEVQKTIQQSDEEKPEVRSGKYNSDDVSIEKFFYYGK